MDCAGYREWLSPYVDDRLSPEERSRFEAHLIGCAGCREELTSLRKMLQALSSAEPPGAPDLLPGIHRQLTRRPWWMSAVRQFLAPWPQSLPLHGAALAATAMLVLVVTTSPARLGVTRRPTAVRS